MKRILQSVVAASLLFTTQAMAENYKCEMILKLSDTEFSKIVKDHVNGIEAGEIDISAQNLSSKYASINLHKCSKLRDLKRFTPDSLQRRNALISLYDNGLDVFNTQPKYDLFERELIKSALKENQKYYTDLSSASFFGKQNESLVFFGMDRAESGKYYLEEIRLDGSTLRKYAKLFSLQELKKQVETSNINAAMKRHLSTITGVSWQLEQHSNYVSIKQNHQGEGIQNNLVVHDWNGIYEISKLTSFTYMKDAYQQSHKLDKDTLLEVIERKNDRVYFTLCNREDEGIFSMKKKSLDKFGVKIKDL